MPVRQAEAVWEGDLKAGKGSIKLLSGAYHGAYSFHTRFENAPGTNPEELLGGAHAGCYSMALSHLLASAGHVPQRVQTRAAITIDRVGDGFKITKIALTCEAVVPGLPDPEFQELAHRAKTGCPISQALAAVPIDLQATLVP